MNLKSTKNAFRGERVFYPRNAPNGLLVMGASSGLPLWLSQTVIRVKYGPAVSREGLGV